MAVFTPSLHRDHAAPRWPTPGRWVSFLLLPAAVLLARPAPVHAREAGAVTLHIHNPARVPAEVFHRKGRGMERLANVSPGSSFSVDTFRGHRFVVYFACSRKAWSYTVKSDIKAEWKLPSRPCG